MQERYQIHAVALGSQAWQQTQHKHLRLQLPATKRSWVWTLQSLGSSVRRICHRTRKWWMVQHVLWKLNDMQLNNSRAKKPVLNMVSSRTSLFFQLESTQRSQKATQQHCYWAPSVWKWLQSNGSRESVRDYSHMKSCEPSQDWLAYTNYGKSTSTTQPEGHKEHRTTSKTKKASLSSAGVIVTLISNQYGIQVRFLVHLLPVFSLPFPVPLQFSKGLKSFIKKNIWGSNMVVWGCLATSGPVRFSVFDETMNFTRYSQTEIYHQFNHIHSNLIIDIKQCSKVQFNMTTGKVLHVRLC